MIFLCGPPSKVIGQKLPKGATVLEEHNLSKHRKLVLWMPNAIKTPNEEDIDFYTCPTQTRGSFYSGDVRVTLIDTSTGRVLNTLHLKGGDSINASPPSLDAMDLPYAIKSGYYYYVPNGSTKFERKPLIMNLKDYNGDGKALEFALFDAMACVGLGTTLIGYSESKDRVIQYPITVHAPEGTTKEYWLDSLFSKKPVRPKYWRYNVDYRGREGTLDMFTVKYDPEREGFVATIRRHR
jgi:hypothetical protein